jgi:hypothetical protein
MDRPTSSQIHASHEELIRWLVGNIRTLFAECDAYAEGNPHAETTSHLELSVAEVRT